MTQDTRLYETYSKWSLHEPVAENGFVVAADLTQEWLLPWWWSNYTKYNNLPVAFVDLGLSKEMKEWCKKRGHYIPLPIPNIFVAEKDSCSSEHIKNWEELYGSHFWESRNAWFKKPLACLQTPYKTSVWMDLDCEVRGSLTSIFSLSIPSSGIMLAQEYPSVEDWDNINSGVILFKKGNPTIEEWAKESLESNHTYKGDQDILHALILKKQIPLGDLPLIYNWSRFSEVNPEALVVHWHGTHGKSFITHQIQKAIIQEAGLLS